MINISTMKACGPGAFEEMGSKIKLPYSGHIPGGINVGTDIVISGRPNPNCDRFSINLCIGATCEQDCALHFNPRFDAGTVVRNHMQGGRWGMEEVSGIGPFRRGQNFDMIIKVTKKGYSVTVNNNHYCDFNHRLPKESVQYLFIKGGVVINFIQCRGTAGGDKYPAAPPPQSYRGWDGGRQAIDSGRRRRKHMGKGKPDMPPPYPGASALSYPGGAPSGGPFYNPAVPFTAAIPGGMCPGRIIYVSGVPHPNPSRFTVSVACGPYDSDDCGFVFDMRFNYCSDRNQTVRTHRQGGAWGPEERHQNFFPCAPNSPFEMMILAESNCFKVAFNNQHFCEFYHRIHPFQRNTHVKVERDVQLTQVRFQ